MLTVAEAKAAYNVAVWDKQSPINGVPAADVIASRTDIPDGGVVYLINRGGNVLYFQPHVPGAPGIMPMTESEAAAYADQKVQELACAGITLEASAAPNPAAIGTTVTVTVILPSDTPDTEVAFQVDGGQAYIEPVASGQASHAYAFAMAGTYHLTVSSPSHAPTVVEVIVQ